MSARSIKEIIEELESVIRYCIDTGHRAGYFAAMYHHVTCRIKTGIDNNEFEDGQRMEQLDVLFANRFLHAWNAYRNQKPLTKSWKLAFEAAEQSPLIILQHLLLGINAHINLDLGIAAVETMKDKDMEGVRKDFNLINAILGQLSAEVQSRMGKVSPLILLLKLHKTNRDEMLIQFSINTAREGAWCFAEELNPKTGLMYEQCINNRDQRIAILAENIVNAGKWLKITLKIIRFFEWHKPGNVIKLLQGEVIRY